MNLFLRLIELKEQEAQLKIELPIAKHAAIEYYKAHPVLTGEKTTGQFSTVDGVKLPAKLTWKLVKREVPNPIFEEKHSRLIQVEHSLEAIHARKLDELKAQIEALQVQVRSLLVNDETEALKIELANTASTIEGPTTEELSVTLPK